MRGEDISYEVMFLIFFIHMKKLIITAHPNPYGFTHRIAETFVRVSQEGGHEVEVLDLYNSKYTQGFLRLQDNNKPIHDPHMHRMHEKIRWADELVFVYPLRRFDFPAILKNWFDVNFSSPFAFKHKSGKRLPEKLLHDKSARIIVTAGSPSWVCYTIGVGHLIIIRIGIFWYCGIRMRSHTLFGNMAKYKTLESREWMLRKVEKIARK